MFKQFFLTFFIFLFLINLGSSSCMIYSDDFGRPIDICETNQIPGGAFPGAEIQSYIMDGDGVYFETNYGKVSAYPAYATGLINKEQYINFSYNASQDRIVNISLVFPDSVYDADAFYWTSVQKYNITPIIGRINYSQIINILSYENITQPQYCDLGDVDNNWFVNATLLNSSYETYCFDSRIDLGGGEYNLTYSVNGTTGYNNESYFVDDWKKITSQFSSMNYMNKKIFTINDVNFVNGTLLQTRIKYKTPPNSVGKFGLYAHSGSPQDVIDGIANVYLELDPWWNTTWQFSRNITINNTDGINRSNVAVRIYLELDNTKTNGTDFRFTYVNETDATNETEIPHWLESSDAINDSISGWNYTNASGYVWVNVTFLHTNATTNTTSIKIFYNASGVSDTSSGNDTFIFFDDFEGSDVSPILWTSSTGTWAVFEGVLKSPDVNGRILTSNATITASNQSMFISRANANNGWVQVLGGNHWAIWDSSVITLFTAAFSSLNTTGYNTDDVFHIFQYDVFNSELHAWQHDNSSELFYAPATTSAAGIILRTGTVNTSYDWIAQTNYIKNQPTFNVGSEQTQVIGGDIDNCQTLSDAGATYNLTESPPVNASTCFTVTAENIILDCAGFTITGDNSSGNYGVFSDQYNTTVKNCIIEEFQYGIHYDGADAGTIENNTINFTYAIGGGIRVVTSISNTTILENTIDYSSASGASTGINLNDASAQNVTVDCRGTTIYGSETSDRAIGIFATNVVVSNCHAIGASTGFFFSNHENGTLQNSSAVNSSLYGIYLLTKSNMIIINNNVTNSTTSGIRAFKVNNTLISNNIINLSNTGITVRQSDDNTITNNTINDVNSFGIYLFQSGGSDRNNLTNNTINTTGSGADGIAIDEGENNTIDCLGATITGSNTSGSIGVRTTRSNNTVKNCVIDNFATGISINTDAAGNATILNNTINITYFSSCSSTSSNCAGIFVDAADNTTISNNTITVKRLGILARNGVDDLLIENNNINATSSNAFIASTNIRDAIIRNNSFVSAGTSTVGLQDTFVRGLFEYNNITATLSGADGALLLGNAENNTIQFNYISVPDRYAIRIDTSTNNNTFKYNNLSAVRFTFRFFDDSSDNNISFNNITAREGGSSGQAVAIAGTGNANNRIFNNSIVEEGPGVGAIRVSGAGSIENIFYNNNISADIWTNDIDGGNFYNTTDEGNIYYWRNGTASWEVYNITTNDGTNWSNAGTDRPFGNATIPNEWIGHDFDYHPFTEVATIFRPIVANISITPNSPNLLETLNCSIFAEDADDAIFNLTVNWFLNGVNQTDLAITNSSYSNDTEWLTQITLNRSFVMQGDDLNCLAYAEDGDVRSANNQTSNVTTSFVEALIPTVSDDAFNGTATISNPVTLFRLIHSLQYTTPFTEDTEIRVFSVFNTISEGVLLAEYQMFDDTNSTELDLVNRSATANDWGSTGLSSDHFNMSNQDTIDINLNQRKTTGTGDDLTSGNVSTAFWAMKDFDTNISFNHLDLNIDNSTTSTTFVKIFSEDFVLTQRGFVQVIAPIISIETDNETLATIMFSIGSHNCSIIPRNLSIGSVSQTCFNPSAFTGGDTVEIVLWAKVDSAANLTVSANSFAIVRQTDEIAEKNLTGITLTSSSLTEIINITITPRVAGRDFHVVGSIPFNATLDATETTFELRAYSSSGLLNTSLLSRRTLDDQEYAVVNIQGSMTDMLLEDITFALYGSTDQGTIEFTGGSLLAESTTDTGVLETNLTCSTLGASNTEYMMVENVETIGTCFNVTAVNVTLNCDGFNITGDNSSTSFGVFSDQLGTIVENCNINNFTNAIKYEDVLNGMILNNILNATQADTTLILTGGSNISVINNTINANNAALDITGSNNNTLQTNNITAITDTALFVSPANRTIITDNILSGGSGNAGAFIEDSQDIIFVNNTVYSVGTNVGLWLFNTNDTLINNNTINNSASSTLGTLILDDGSTSNNVSFNTIISLAAFPAVKIGESAGAAVSNNIFNNNSIDANTSFAFVNTENSGSTNNIFYANNISALTWVNDSFAGNFYNTTGIGNIWNFANGTASWVVYDINSSTNATWADEGANWPFNASNVNEWFGLGNDSRPFTNVTLRIVNLTISNIASKDIFRIVFADLPVSCIDAENQTGPIGIYNITNENTVIINISMRVNATITGFNISVNTADSCPSGITTLNTSNQLVITNIAVNTSELVWAWADANSSIPIPMEKFTVIAEAS